jgi:hypothetical protein
MALPPPLRHRIELNALERARARSLEFDVDLRQGVASDEQHTERHWFHAVSDSFYGPSFLRVSGEKCNDGKRTYDGHGEPDDAVRGSP